SSKNSFRFSLAALLGALSLTFSAQCLAQASSPPLSIITPGDGALVHPGQNIDVTVNAAAGISLPHGVALLATDPIEDSEIVPAPPFHFSIAIPPKIRFGRYQLTA